MPSEFTREMMRLARRLLSKEEYVYIWDPDHEQNPGPGFIKTESGWSKGGKKEYDNVNKALLLHDRDIQNMTDEEQAELAEEEEKFSLASNHGVDERELKKLSSDPDPVVRSGVAGNPRTSPELLDRLADDRSTIVVNSVLSNPSMSMKTRQKLSKHSDETVRSSIARNTHGDSKEVASILESLSYDPSSSVRRQVSKNPDATETALDNLRNDRDEQIRMNVVMHEHTSQRTLKYMSQFDDDSSIREFAKGRLEG